MISEKTRKDNNAASAFAILAALGLAFLPVQFALMAAILGFMAMIYSSLGSNLPYIIMTKFRSDATIYEADLTALVFLFFFMCCSLIISVCKIYLHVFYS